MTERHDDEMHRAFVALNRTVQASAPTFATIASPSGLQAAQRRYRIRRASVLLALLVIPSVLIARTRSTTTFDFERFSRLTGLDPGALSWKAPSDFLLSLPGAELLQTVPTIDMQVPVIRDDTPRAPAHPTLRRGSDS